MANLTDEQLLQRLNLDAKRIKDSLKNKKILQKLKTAILASNLESYEKTQTNLIYRLATEIPDSCDRHIEFIAEYIAQSKLKANINFERSIEYVKELTLDQQIDKGKFDQFCGVGINYTEDQIKQIVSDYINSQKDEFLQNRYCFKFQDKLANLKKEFPFADPGKVTVELKKQIEQLLGPETAEDKAIKNKWLKGEDKNPVQQEITEEKKATKNILTYEGRDMASAKNNQENLKWRKENFGNICLTRFPPEPNGYLHIGHIKAMRFNFKFAEEHGQGEGKTYLRFDDTNPEKESKEFIENIKSNLEWLGFKPFKITHSSEYFDQLYEYAVQLIKLGLAYVCHQTKDEMSKGRQDKTDSPFRNRSVEENLKLFNDMKNGLFDEGAAMLRGKIDMSHPNLTLRDPVLYRVRFVPHPHIGSKWCIYPLYDYTHPLCDSIEGISYSLCTLEFEIRRELYYWVLDKLNLFKPMVWEYSRLNIEYSLTSKRKLMFCVANKIVRGWDDPRLFTINALKRKGYPVKALDEFCQQTGVTRSSNENFIEIHSLEHVIRQSLDITSPRTLAVVDPIKVIITNINDVFTLEAPDFPGVNQEEKGMHNITLSNIVYVEQTDVSLEDSDKFYGFAKGKAVGLKYAGVFKCTDILTDEKGNILHVLAEKIENVKPKTFVNWISQIDAVQCEVRLYKQLLNTKFPNNIETDQIPKYLNPDALVVKEKSLMNRQSYIQYRNLIGKPILYTTQFERQGYFAVDYDTDIQNNKYVWNLTVGLFDSARQKAIANMKK